MASHRSVFVGNIPYQATEKQLIDVCEEIGPVVSFRFILDKKTGKQKGYGFCTYLDEETALSACRNLKGCLVRGRQLRVSLAKDGKCTDITTNQGQCSSCVGSNLVTAHHPSGTTPGQMPQQSIIPASMQPGHAPVLHQAPACAEPSQISCSQVCAKTSNGLQTEVQSWLASGHGSSMVPWNQGQGCSLVGPNLCTAQLPSGATTADPAVSQLLGLSSASAVVSETDGSQFSYSRQVTTAAATPVGLPTEVESWSATEGAIEGMQNRMISQEDSDRLTNYLARLSKCKLQAISSEIKLLAADDNQMVRELVQHNPILMRAQLQADIMLGIATTEMMQTARNQQYLSHLGQMPQQSITPISVQPAHVPVLHKALACTDSSQISCSSQVCAECSNDFQIKDESWPARGDCPSMVPWNQVSVVQQKVATKPGMPIQAPASTDGSQFSYSRWVSAAATTPINLPTEVNPWSELQPTKIRKLACLI